MKPINKEDRVGQISYDRFGSRIEIIDYKKRNDITVKFDDGHIVKTNYGQFIAGKIKNPYNKTTCGIGYIGEGEYKTGYAYKKTKQGRAWEAMMARCYSKKTQLNRPSYIGCTVDTIWHNFQVFAKWYDENIYDIEGEKTMCLDKDILIKGNRIYSPDTCTFVPNRINQLLVTRKVKRGTYPLGVSAYKSKFAATCNDGYGNDNNLGYFKTPEEAFNAYKIHKEKIIKKVADDYKQYIPEKLYKALYNYVVEITD